MSKKPDGAHTEGANRNARSNETYGGWHFARDFSNGVFSLLNSGKIFPVFGLLILVIMGLVVWRLPDTELAEVVRDFLATVRSSFGFAVGALIVSNLMWAWLNRRMRTIYQNEIDRLSELRNKLLHGGSELVPLKDHHTSNGSQKESYILPQPPTKHVKKR